MTFTKPVVEVLFFGLMGFPQAREIERLDTETRTVLGQMLNADKSLDSHFCGLLWKEHEPALRQYAKTNAIKPYAGWPDFFGAQIVKELGLA